MSEKLKKRLALAGKIVGGTIVILGLLCVGYVMYVGIAINYNQAHLDELIKKGPFTGEAIWVTEDESMYMVCKPQSSESDRTNVYVYLRKDGVTVSGRLLPLDGFSGVEFDLTDHGNRVWFEAEADVKWGKTLVLKNFSEEAAAYLPEGTKKVVLTKQPYGEYPGTMPQFDYS